MFYLLLDDATPSRIPTRRTPLSGRNTASSTSSARKVNGTIGSSSRPRTPSGLASPASPAGRHVLKLVLNLY